MRANIYIRKDNEDAWNAIEDKSAWVNDLLTEYRLLSMPPPIIFPVDPEGVPVQSQPPQDADIRVLMDKPKFRDFKLCEHGAVKGKCTWPGCKFNRFQKK